MAWRHIPRSIRDDPDKAGAFLALQPGVPDHLHASLVAWIEAALPERRYGGVAEELFPRLTAIERALHLRLPGRDAQGKRRGLFGLIDTDAELMLDVVNYMLEEAGGFGIPPVEVVQLRHMLDEGGSEWTVERVEGDRFRLVSRVEPAVQATLQEAMTPADNASDHLRAAWGAAFGRNPTAATAYQRTVKALEHVFIPIVCPKRQNATLGHVIGDALAAPGQFVVNLETQDGTGVSVVIGQINAIWRTQQRHDPGIQGTPTTETIEEARDAVVMAASLVQLARQGGFRRK